MLCIEVWCNRKWIIRVEILSVPGIWKTSGSLFLFKHKESCDSLWIYVALALRYTYIFLRVTSLNSGLSHWIQMRESMWKYILHINPPCQWEDYYFYCPYAWFNLNKPFRMEHSFTTILMIKTQIFFLPWKISLMVSYLPRFVLPEIKIFNFTGKKIVLSFLNEHS